MIKEIDGAMVLRIETKEGTEKEKAIALRNITIRVYWSIRKFDTSDGRN